MLTPHGADVSLPIELLSADMPEDQPGLTARIRELEAAITSCNAHVYSLMAQESPAEGVFHAAAIHTAKQMHMQLHYLKDVCIARLKAVQ